MALLINRNLARSSLALGWRGRTFSSSVDVELARNESELVGVVGLEVHAQINSKSKLFSGASCDGFRKAPNACVSLFDAAIPGTLPRLNKRCVEVGVKTALALSCHINEISMFDRKHYFYADQPAGFQITQQRLPLAVNGSMTFPVRLSGKETYQKTVRLHQLQLEQDSGKSLHFPELKRSLIDLNRAGAPLMEFVFEPDLCDGEEAAAMVKELALILQMLDVCSCNWHEGALRVDANISIHRKGEPLGVRTEVKNISSPRSIARAVTYEINRQIELVESGGVVVNETRNWDSALRETIRMRDKEVQRDYRFMPEPNLPPLNLNAIKGFDVNELKTNLPILPQEIRMNLSTKYGIHPTTASILIGSDVFAPIFFKIISKHPPSIGKHLANFLISDVTGALNAHKIPLEESPLSIAQLEDLFFLQENRQITKLTEQRILAEMIKDPSQLPTDIVNKNDWKQINDRDFITKISEEAIAQNPKFVKFYKKGRETMLKRAIQTAANERANVAIVSEVLKTLIK